MNFTLMKCYQILVPSAYASDSFQGSFAVLRQASGERPCSRERGDLPARPPRGAGIKRYSLTLNICAVTL